MATAAFDMNDLKRRMQGAIASLKQELSGLRTGRASTALLDHVQVEAYGSHMPLNQLATIGVPEPRLLSVQVWDRSMVHAVEKAIIAANLGLTPATEGQVIRLRIPELNEERRKELVKVAHKYTEAAKVAVRHERRGDADLPAACSGAGPPRLDRGWPPVRQQGHGLLKTCATEQIRRQDASPHTRH